MSDEHDENNLPPEYASLTLRDVLRLYTGPHALPVPPVLVGWVECAQQTGDLLALERELAQLERERA